MAANSTEPQCPWTVEQGRMSFISDMEFVRLLTQYYNVQCVLLLVSACMCAPMIACDLKAFLGPGESAFGLPWRCAVFHRDGLG